MLTGYTLGVLLDYLSGVLHLPTNYTHGVLLGYPGMLTIARPLGCCWTISQGVLHLLTSYALEVLLDYLRGVLHMLTTPWGAVGLPQVCAVHTHFRINYACAYRN